MSDIIRQERDYDADFEDCGNCAGEGYVFGCSWDWQCDTYDAGEGTCLCTQNCDWCNPRKLTAEQQADLARMREVLAENPRAQSGDEG